MKVLLDDEDVQRIARAVVELLPSPAVDAEGYLAPEAAAAYLGVSRKRIYDLKSMGAIEPDGYDGRTPLFTRQTLDAYVRSDRA